MYSLGSCKALRFRFCVVRTFVNISKPDDERRIKWALIIERARVAWAWFMGRKEGPLGSYSSPASSSSLLLLFHSVHYSVSLSNLVKGVGFEPRNAWRSRRSRQIDSTRDDLLILGIYSRLWSVDFRPFTVHHGSTRCEDGWQELRIYIYIFIEKYSKYKLILQIILQFSSLVRIILNIG